MADLQQNGGQDAEDLLGCMEACNMDGIERHLRAGEKLNSQQPNLSRVFLLACHSGREAIVSAALGLSQAEIRSLCGTFDGDGNLPSHLAAAEGHAAILALLAKHHLLHLPVHNSGGLTCFHVAAKRGHVECLKVCLAHGADVNIKAANKDMPLHLAALGGHLDAVDLLLQCKAKVNLGGEKRRTPLHYAAFGGNSEVVSRLLKAKATINKSDSSRKRPLHYAIEARKPEIIKILLGNGADMYIRDCNDQSPLELAMERSYDTLFPLFENFDANYTWKDGSTLLNTAIHSESAEMLEMLLMRGADPNKPCDGSVLPLHIACFFPSEKSIAMTKVLLKHGAKITDNFAPLHGIVESFMIFQHVYTLKRTHSLALAKVFLEAGVDPLKKYSWTKGSALALAEEIAAQSGRTELVELFRAYVRAAPTAAPCNGRADGCPVIAAIEIGDLELLKKRLGTATCLTTSHSGCDFDTCFPIHQAIRKGWEPGVGAILDHGFHVNTVDDRRTSLLHIAARSNQPNVLKLLLQRGAKVNVRDKGARDTPLHEAVMEKAYQCAELLLQAGAETEAENHDHETPLIVACMRGDLPLVKVLLRYGADPNTAGAYDVSALLDAIRCGRVDIVTALLEAGADVNQGTFWETSPLHFALTRKSEELARVLLRHGADINALDRQGRPVLFMALRTGQNNIALQLLQSGVSPSVVDDKGNTALHWAYGSSAEVIEKLVLEHGLAVNAKNKKGHTPLHAIVEPLRTKPDEEDVIFGLWLDDPFESDRVTGYNDSPDMFGTSPLSRRLEERHNRRKLPTPGYVARISTLVRLGADPFAEDNEGISPIMQAVMWDVVLALEPLIVSLPEAEKKVALGTILFWAMVHKSPPVLKWCLGDGAVAPRIDINHRFRTGTRPLHIAVSLKDTECSTYALDFLPPPADVVATLLEYPGIDVNATDDEGNTPMHIAVMERNVAACAHLAPRSNLSLRNKDGMTPLGYFKELEEQYEGLRGVLGQYTRPAQPAREAGAQRSEDGPSIQPAPVANAAAEPLTSPQVIAPGNKRASSALAPGLSVVGSDMKRQRI